MSRAFSRDGAGRYAHDVCRTGPWSVAVKGCRPVRRVFWFCSSGWLAALFGVVLFVTLPASSVVLAGACRRWPRWVARGAAGV